MSKSTAQLLSEIESFLEKTGMPPTTFGLEAVKDGHLVRWLRAGKGITLDRADRIREFIASNSTTRVRGRARKRSEKCHA